jgi:hypothetical protein
MTRAGLPGFRRLAILNPAFVAKIATFLRALAFRRFAAFVHLLLEATSAFLAALAHLSATENRRIKHPSFEAEAQGRRGLHPSHLDIFQPHWQPADTLAGGVIYGIADRGVGADIAQLTKPLRAGRIDVIVLLGE